MRKIYFDKALQILKRTDVHLIVFRDSDCGTLRDTDGDEYGDLSRNMVGKLIEEKKVYFIANGSGLLDHERYYKLNK